MSTEHNYKMGFAGTLAKMFIKSKLTLVIAFSSMLLGVMAVYLTPKEEEPQISVPMIDIQTAAPGLDAHEVERKVTEVIERAVWGLDGVEYVYSGSQNHGSLVTVRFKVGEPMEPSLVKIHHKLMTIRSELPKEAMTSEVKSFSIDDVPFLVLTFSSKEVNDYKLRSLIAPLARELSSTPDLTRVELLGGLKRSVRVIVNPTKLKMHGVSLGFVAKALQSNDSYMPVGKNWSSTEVFDIDVGGRYESVQEIKEISIGQRGGAIIKIKDVADVIDGPEERTRVSSLITKESGGIEEGAVSVVFAKRKGTNVVSLAKELIDRANVFSSKIPSNIKMSVIRDYGSTADEKSKELIEHLMLATLSVTVLIALVMGFRAALVVATAIPVTLALTLAVYYFMGYTLNRVTLFALIFSIGILVDDAIVVVENIERHLKMNKKLSLVKATLNAVAEVGNPTILATFAVVGAILPMAFVSGMMGPYMKPIPVGASFAMILSLFVAFIVTPWAAVKILKHEHHSHDHVDVYKEEPKSKLDALYEKMMNSLLGDKRVSVMFISFTIVLLLGAMSLVYFKNVKVKMLPFDNKEEFQVLMDYPTTTPLMVNKNNSVELAREILKNKNVLKVQVFAGEPAPFSFSGMVKHSFLRRSDYQSDLQILLKPKGERKASSHAIIEELRPVIKKYSDSKMALSKVLEIPPGPPVMSTVVAEVYGPDEATRKRVAKEIYDIFASVDGVVDLDTTSRLGRPRLVYPFDQARGGLYGTSADQVMRNGSMIFSETPISLLKDNTSPEEVNINLSVQNERRSGSSPFDQITTPSFESGVVDVKNVLGKPKIIETETLYRKNLKPVSYIMSELSGTEEAPVYGILKLTPKINYPLQTAAVPWNTTSPVVKWDGEWFITYEVFRDMGGAFAVVMVLIYILVLGWFKSFTVPLIIMAPIPISLIGILPGHVIVGSYFTATSMIGFIAGAGIIVRNSIILVDFIEHQLSTGMNLKDAVVSAGILRFRPMLLTAAAVVVGSSVMLFDPIFQGLAVSLIFGEVAATVLSRFAVPVLYYWIVGKSRVKHIMEKDQEVL
jgi:multidrug efflux pump subunit AcrB